MSLNISSKGFNSSFNFKQMIEALSEKNLGISWSLRESEFDSEYLLGSLVDSANKIKLIKVADSYEINFYIRESAENHSVENIVATILAEIAATDIQELK